jgi:multiple sugar transport system substrate-binding protein
VAASPRFATAALTQVNLIRVTARYSQPALVRTRIAAGAATVREPMARLLGWSSLLAGVTALFMRAAFAAPDAVPAQTTTIEIWWHEYGPMTAYIKELIQQYKQARPDVTVNGTVIAPDQINRKTSIALATGTGPDIIDNDAAFYSLYYSKGMLEPINLAVFNARSYAELISRYTAGGLDAGTFENVVDALPYQGNSMSLFINNRAFRAAGLDPKQAAPRTWEAMMKLGPLLKVTREHRIVQKAFDFPYVSNRWEVEDFQPLVEQFGGRLLSYDGKTAYLNSPQAVNALPAPIR